MYLIIIPDQLNTKCPLPQNWHEKRDWNTWLGTRALLPHFVFRIVRTKNRLIIEAVFVLYIVKTARLPPASFTNSPNHKHQNLDRYSCIFSILHRYTAQPYPLIPSSSGCSCGCPGKDWRKITPTMLHLTATLSTFTTAASHIHQNRSPPYRDHNKRSLT